MKMPAATLLALLLVPAAIATESEVTPVQKVLQLMENMLAKGKKEKHDEEVQFAAYQQFCVDTSAEKEKAIKEADEKIEVLKADIEKYEATAKKLTKEIAGHEADIATWDSDMDKATEVRKTEKAAYDDEHKDLSESVSALERAIEVLKKQAYNRKQASLVQVRALQGVKLIPDDAKKAIAAFLQDDPAEDSLLDLSAAPEAIGYEFQSHGIIEMLSKLLSKFFSERTTVEKEELDRKNAYKLTMQDLTAQSDQAKQDVSDKTQSKAKNLEMAAEAKADLAETQATRAADKKYLDDLTAICATKAADFESRQTLRSEELEALAKAVEIISGESVAGSADKHLPTLLQTKATALAALRAEAVQGSQARAAAYLQERARQTGSRVLSTLAARVQEDPFRKVKKMIKDLIVRLMEEANEEAEHKGWCDTELSTNKQTREEKTSAVETLHAEIDELEASIQTLTQEIEDLAKAIEELDKAMAEATELRQQEKAENLATIKDAKEAQTAVAEAVAIVKTFYAKAGEATALVQQQPPQAPEIFDSPYKGMQGMSGGVIGMLEVIEADFARLEADTAAAEEAAQKAYDKFMTDSSADKEAKQTDHDHKTAKKEDQEQTLASKKEDLANTQKELDAAMAYFDKLKPSCVDASVSYDTRVSNRKEEIESLQEALKILNGEDIP
jgi:predicted  nucleic acid-binding Zn-ribbon protein